MLLIYPKYYYIRHSMVSKALKLLGFIIVCEMVGIVSTPFTISAIQSWYVTLQKPFFSPPNFIFGPVWTILYACMAVAAYSIYQKGIKKPAVKRALLLFSLQLVLNFVWSLLFFALRSPSVAFLEIILLWLSILGCAIVFYPIRKTATYLFIPYIIWVSFALLLNFSIVILNP